MARQPGALLNAVINITTATDTTIIAAVASQRIRIYAIWMWSGGTTSVTPKTATTPLSGTISMVAQSHFDKEPRRDEEPWFTCGVNEAFVLTTSGAAQVSGIVYYEQN
jgi:hypothetical protein